MPKKNYSIIQPVKKLLLHIHPARIDERAIGFSRTFGLGGISALLFLVLCFSGIILRFSYVPTVDQAYSSIVNLQTNTVFGQFIRNIHHITAQLFIIASILHLVRTYYAQASFQGRSSNWVYGLILLFFVLASAFTGYLLPWDQLSYWAFTVFAQTIEYIPLIGHSIAFLISGGDEVGQTTLLLFYNVHTGILPLMFIVFMSVHFWLVRKAGGIALPIEEGYKKLEVVPNLVIKELLTATIVIAVISIVAIFYQVPLNDQANPLVSSNTIKAPWYFLGVQELMFHFHPLVGLTIILGVVVYFISLPYLGYNHLRIGVWFHSALGKRMVIISAFLSFVYTIILVYMLEYFVSISNAIVMSVVSLLAYIIPVTLYLCYWRRTLLVNKEEMLLSITTIIIVSYLAMMLIALLLRGDGMVLMIWFV